MDKQDNIYRHLIRIIVLFLFFLPTVSKAEGTRELKPEEDDNGNVLLWSDYTEFGLYDAPEEEQIKIRVTSTDETIYFGFNNKNGMDATGNFSDQGDFVPDVPFRIVSPSGDVVFESTMADPGEPGYINSWEEAVTGPDVVSGAGGYNPVSFDPNETGDYVIEFDPAARNVDRLNLHFFDITVANAANEPQYGRLHSKGWQLSTEGFTNDFVGKMYPYDGNTVYEIDFNGTEPWVFVVNLNSTGPRATGDFFTDRQSLIGNYTYGEYEVFLNPPNETLYPTDETEITLETEVERLSCVSSEFCLNFTTNVPGILEGYIDLNENGTYEEDTDVYFEERFSESGTTCIPWDGLDAEGQPADVSAFDVVATFGFEPIHMPIYDVEHNYDGYKVDVVRPGNVDAPLIFWDDRRITDGFAIDEQVNIQEGCLSVDNGCHQWINRGAIDGVDVQDRQETISTWWYSSRVEEITEYTDTDDIDVLLSFDDTELVRGDTTVCRGDIVDVFVYNDGTHFDTDRYTYTWYVNEVEAGNDVRENGIEVLEDEMEVVIEAEESSECISYDTLYIYAVDPVVLEADVENPPCGSDTGSIQVSIVSGPPNPSFFWDEFPGHDSGDLSGLERGEYGLTVRDTDFPGCAKDTSFMLVELDGITIDTIEVEETTCYAREGRAEVFMEDENRDYEFSWDNQPYEAINVKDSLLPGTHTIAVRETGTECMDETAFEIPEVAFETDLTVLPDTCQAGIGEVWVHLPDYSFTVTWEGISGSDTVFQQLDAGSYTLEVSADDVPDCTFDSLVTVENNDIPVEIDDLVLEDSECGAPTGEAEVFMPPDDYTFSWDAGAYTVDQSQSDLAVGEHTLEVRGSWEGCTADTIFYISGDVPFDVQQKPDVCGSQSGSITVSSPDAIEVTWDDVPQDGLHRDNLPQGLYTFTVMHESDPSCSAKRTVTIEDSTYDVPVDFEYEPVEGKNGGYGKDFQFTLLAEGIASAHWSFGDGGTSTTINPLYAYDEVNVFDVEVEAEDSLGCTGMAQKIVNMHEVEQVECGIELPNIFSPNGDGSNDDIGILGYAPEVELIIFNRWGEVVFRTFDIEKRWDGNYRGTEAPTGVYPYILYWRCPEDMDKHRRNRRVGDITLVR